MDQGRTIVVGAAAQTTVPTDPSFYPRDPLLHDLICDLQPVHLHEHHMSIAMYAHFPEVNMVHRHTRLSQKLRCTSVIDRMIARLGSDKQDRDVHQVYQPPGWRLLLETAECRARADCNGEQVRRGLDRWQKRNWDFCQSKWPCRYDGRKYGVHERRTHGL